MRARQAAKAIGAATLTTLAGLLLALPAAAVPSWHSPMTVTTVRGIPDPMVAIDGGGKATIVYSSAPVGSIPGGPGVYAAVRFPGSAWGRPSRLGNGVEPRIAVVPSGATAVAWVDGDHIEALLQPAPGQLGGSGGLRRSVHVGGQGASDLRLEVDAAGRATLVWKPRRASESTAAVQLRSVAISADGTVGPVQDLGPPGECRTLSVDANLAGDTAALCSPGDRIHVRPARDDLFGTEPYAPLEGSNAGYVTVDGAGAVTLAVPVRLSPFYTRYSVRPRGGAFGPPRTFDDDAALFAQEDRTVAVWHDEGELGYAIRPAGGGDFGPARSFRTAADSPVEAFSDVTAARGPLPLMTGIDPFPDPGAPLRLSGVGIGADGKAFATGRSTVPGEVDFPGNVAGSESGVAVATWEQRCEGGFAVMAMVLDDKRGTTAPPCQDRRAPRVIVPRKRGRLVGRAVKIRVACDERCRLTAKVRVTRQGRRKPLAGAKTARQRAIAGRRGAWLKLGLSPAETGLVGHALATRRKITLRLAVRVRDDYGNGAVRRFAVPLRR